MITNGTIVTWASQSGGSITVKTGKVLGFIPSLRELNESNFGITLKPLEVAKTSINDRYLVEVIGTHKRTGEPLVPRYYGPRASIVDNQNVEV